MKKTDIDMRTIRALKAGNFYRLSVCGKLQFNRCTGTNERYREIYGWRRITEEMERKFRKMLNQ